MIEATLLLLIGLFLCTHDATGYNILLGVFDGTSHTLMFANLGELFIKGGHNVTMLVGSNYRNKIPKVAKDVGINLVEYKKEGPIVYEGPFQERIQDVIHNPSVWKSIDFMGKYSMEVFLNESLHLIKDEHAMKFIEKGNFDFFISDLISPAFLIIPYKFSIPYALYGLDVLSWPRKWPYMPSYVPALVLPFSDRMNFVQRFVNFLLYTLAMLPLAGNMGKEYVMEYVPEKPPITFTEILMKADLYISLGHFVVSTPRPVMPDMVSVGALIAQPAQPLPKDLEEFMQRAIHGVVLVSFGSLMDAIPTHKFKMLLLAFSNVKPNVIWKYKGDLSENIPEKIKIMKWIPQNDLLGHDKTILFITHGGLNSITEAIYHGVPFITFPLALDQNNNAAISQSKGYCKTMNINHFTSEKLIINIKEMTNDLIYRERAKHASAILKDIKQSGVNDPVFWVEHVIRHGSKHLRSHAFELKWYEYLMIDVILAFGLVIVLSFYIMYRLLKCILFLLCRKVVRHIKIKQS